MQKVLVVEDNETLREELKILLENAGYEVALVSDFSNVGKQMEDAGSDLVLLRTHVLDIAVMREYYNVYTNKIR